MCVLHSKLVKEKNIQIEYFCVLSFQPNYNSHKSHVWEASKNNYYTKFHSFAIILSFLILSSVHCHTTLDNSQSGAWTPVGSLWRHLKSNCCHSSKTFSSQTKLCPDFVFQHMYCIFCLSLLLVWVDLFRCADWGRRLIAAADYKSSARCLCCLLEPLLSEDLREHIASLFPVSLSITIIFCLLLFWNTWALQV